MGRPNGIFIGSPPTSNTSIGSVCLYFNRDNGQHVNHGYFWQRNVQHYYFFWEAWINAEVGAEYIISDGYGGAHNLLFGCGGGNPCAMAGNVYSSGLVSFGSVDSFLPGEWHHVAVGWDGTQIVTFLNGVPSGVTAFAGPRETNTSPADGVLFVGGSTHSNYKGYIKCMRGFEMATGVDLPISLNQTLKPTVVFKAALCLDSGNTVYPSQFLADYTTPMETIPDMSAGYLGATHAGILRDGNDQDIGIYDGYYATVATLPVWRPITFTAPLYTGSVTATPANAVIFDAFERTNVTYAWANTLGLGTAPTGQAWSNTSWGILGTYAYQSVYGSVQYATADAAKTDCDVRLVRKTGYANYPSVTTRYTDIDNLIRVDMNNAGGCAVVQRVGGVQTLLTSGGSFGNSWTTLRVVSSGTNLKVYLDNSGSPIANVTMSGALTGTHVGMMSPGPTDRIKSITVY